MKENSELVKVITQSGVEQSTASALKDAFLPYFEQAEEWASKAKELVVTSEMQVREMQMARAARLALKEIRVSADKKRKELKEDSIRYGKAVQGVYNVIDYLISPIESHLKEQEDFVKIKKAKRREALKQAREEEIEAERKAKEEQERIRKENERLKKEAEKLELERQKAEAERQKELARIQAEREKERQAAEKARKEVEAKAEAERQRLEREAALEKAKREEEERKAAELRAEVERERQRQEAEQKAKEEARLKSIKDAALAPDKEKLQRLIDAINSIQMPELATKEAGEITKSVKELLAKVVGYINTKASQL